MLALMLCTTACKRNQDTTPYISMAINETQCANPWSSEVVGRDNYEYRLTQWLKDKRGIRIKTIAYVKTGDEGMYASCSSPSNYQIRISVRESDVTKAEELGFVKQ
ncbi:hypothetical protein EG028_22830 [Chitinophaga barathri]|uniref:Uncharacterized protein n=2 Tax=Chitinophaga barathri TaxID=1647451 RepID=A0A3N4MFX6_9BACT|nr:hypothetical protein EG028_22830 [Chitinophaga barathri]